ncbi:hypothetical protein PRIPAC_89219, partial [Pristionchus pacificus]|uniref:G protein-coupled receptor n=1 Tax=Pristionchus pacificus TaxID=54126 RepID=A0A2A6B755_PRIPA
RETMAMSQVIAIIFVLISDVLIYLSLPLQIRILIVIIFPKKKLNLDPSFQTIIIHATIANLIFALDHCFIQEPASLGFLFDVYQLLGPYLAKIELIKSTLVITIGSILHLVLSATRLTAIIVPMSHARIWSGKKLPYGCAALWIIAAIGACPLFLPNATKVGIITNVFNSTGIEFFFVGQYTIFYSIGCSLVAGVVEVFTLLAYAALLARLNSFRRYSVSGAESVRRTTRGVIRTTIASIMISMGSWLILVFFIFYYGYQITLGRGPPFSTQEFSVIFKLLNAINNVLTPWVIFLGFPKVREIVFHRESSIPDALTVMPHNHTSSTTPRTQIIRRPPSMMSSKYEPPSLHFAHSLASLTGERKYSLSGAENVKRAANGVIRTTLASVLISMGSWILVFFFIYLYTYQFLIGNSPFTKLEFALWFKFLNGINNVLTPWVLLLSFPKVRNIVFIRESTGSDAVLPPRNPPRSMPRLR